MNLDGPSSMVEDDDPQPSLSQLTPAVHSDKFKPPDIVIRRNESSGKYNVQVGELETLARGADNLAIYMGMWMQECAKLRWILHEVTRRSGNNLVAEVTRETESGAWERIEIRRDKQGEQLGPTTS